MGQKKSRLPAAFQEVKWIGCSGTQYIQTNVAIGQPTSLYCESDFECQNMVTGVDYPIVWCQGTKGSSDHSSSYKFPNVYNGKTELQGFGIVGAENKPFTVINNQRVLMTFDYKPSLQIITFNESSIRRTYSGPTSANNKLIRLLKSTKVSGTDAFFKGRLYHFLLELNGVKMLDVVPCYRRSDGVVGLYDIVSNSFLTNAGTGEFTKGENV